MPDPILCPLNFAQKQTPQLPKVVNVTTFTPHVTYALLLVKRCAYNQLVKGNLIGGRYRWSIETGECQIMGVWCCSGAERILYSLMVSFCKHPRFRSFFFGWSLGSRGGGCWLEYQFTCWLLIDRGRRWVIWEWMDVAHLNNNH